MTADELAAMIAEEIDNNSGTRAILAKVQRGTATLADSERFTGITAEITGRLLADNVLSLPLSDRQVAFVDITAARYRDTFSVFSAVQRALDERLGINLAVVDPGFEKARAQKAGHALADQTVPESTVVRRAESAGENIVRSQHDRIVQKQAEFRDRAGLSCSAIREGGAKCCDWCASVSGKYPASDTPQGFWGRHDNCKCSILYETRKGVQRLGGSTKKWEPLRDAGAPEPVRLTAEQAAELEARHPVIAFTSGQAASLQDSVLTNAAGSGTIFTIAAYPNRRIRSDGNQVVDKATYQKLTRDFIRRGGIIRNDEEAARILEAQHVHAAYLPSLWAIAFSPEPTISEVLEETYHAEQDRKHMFGIELTDEVLLRREIDAQHYLLSLTERYKIPESEVELTKFNLANYERDLEKLLQSQGGGGSG